MKFFLFFAAIIAVCSASGLIGYGHGIVAAPVTSVTHRQDIYGAKVIAAPVLAGNYSIWRRFLKRVINFLFFPFA